MKEGRRISASAYAIIVAFINGYCCPLLPQTIVPHVTSGGEWTLIIASAPGDVFTALSLDFSDGKMAANPVKVTAR